MKIKQISLLAAAMALAGTAAANHHESTAEKVKMLDTDGDGRVSQAEFTAKDGKNAADFARIDANRDGYVTAAEMDAYKAGMKSGKDPHQAGHHQSGQHQSSPSKMKQADTDGDGRVSQAEHTAWSTAEFSRMDTNRDGYITSDEMDKHHQQMQHMQHDGHQQHGGAAHTMRRSTSPTPDQTPPDKPALPPVNPPRQP